MFEKTSPKMESHQTYVRRELELRRILIVFSIAFVVRLLHILALKVSPIFNYKIGDAERYDAWARTLADGNWIGEGVFYQAPLYPYFLGVIYSTLGDSILTVRIVQSFLGAVSCVLVMLAATNLFGKRAGFISGICMSLYAPSIFLEGLVQKTTLALFFLSLLLWLISKIVYRPKIGTWTGIGIATAALCLTRENALVLLPVFGLWIGFGLFGTVNQRRESSGFQSLKKRVSWSMAFACGLTLLLGPVALRNYLVGGQLHLTTSQLGPNFYIGNNPNSTGSYRPLRPGRGDARYEQKDAVELAEIELGRKLTPKEVSQFYLAKSFEFITQSPRQWLGLMALKFGMTFNRWELIDTEDQYTVARISPIIGITDFVFNFGTLLPLALLGIYWTRARWRRLSVIYLMLLAFAITVIAFFVFGRYRFPLIPPLMLFVGPAVLGLRNLVRIGNWKQVGMVSAVVASLAIICHLQLFPFQIGKGITLSNYGVQAMIRDDFHHAERFLAEAAQVLPESAVVQNNLGVLYRETDRKQLAIRHFEQALELEPADKRIKQNFSRLVSHEHIE